MPAPTILWLRRDLRLADNPALNAAIAAGGPVIPVFVLDPLTQALPAAPKWRMGLGLEHFANALAGVGSKLILRSGDVVEVLRALATETGATSILWNRLYDPETRARDTHVKEGLREAGLTATSYNGHVLFEPWTVETKTGGYYKVYSPFWRAVRDRDPGLPLPPPAAVPGPATWPASDDLEDWQMGRAMRRGAAIVARHIHVGEDRALARLAAFTDDNIEHYKAERDMLDRDACSGLSENLTYGEISARTIWHAGWRGVEQGRAGAEHFVKELVWRDFAHHLVYHTPQITSENWRPQWDAFPWASDSPHLTLWQQGRTGMQAVDAAMREMYVTGRMHNRARMLVASYLTKHLMVHWKAGMDWFAECLVDWDPASNAMGWQWTAGSGPDAAPYFRIYNPETQAEKFDPRGTYRRRWLAEITNRPTETALEYFDAIPKSWRMAPDHPYPAAPIVTARAGREAALAAYEARKWA